MYNKEKEIALLKKKAAWAYQRYRSIHSDATCGATLLQHISPAAATAAREFDEAATKLRELDPNCPAFTPLSRG